MVIQVNDIMMKHKSLIKFENIQEDYKRKHKLIQSCFKITKSAEKLERSIAYNNITNDDIFVITNHCSNLRTLNFFG